MQSSVSQAAASASRRGPCIARRLLSTAVCSGCRAAASSPLQQAGTCQHDEPTWAQDHTLEPLSRGQSSSLHSYLAPGLCNPCCHASPGQVSYGPDPEVLLARHASKLVQRSPSMEIGIEAPQGQLLQKRGSATTQQGKTRTIGVWSGPLPVRMTRSRLDRGRGQGAAGPGWPAR
jgi:hypothetical protein